VLTAAFALSDAEPAQKPVGDRADQDYASELSYVPPKVEFLASTDIWRQGPWTSSFGRVKPGWASDKR
jgi:hypothetical protein